MSTYINILWYIKYIMTIYCHAPVQILVAINLICFDIILKLRKPCFKCQIVKDRLLSLFVINIGFIRRPARPPCIQSYFSPSRRGPSVAWPGWLDRTGSWTVLLAELPQSLSRWRQVCRSHSVASQIAARCCSPQIFSEYFSC